MRLKTPRRNAGKEASKSAYLQKRERERLNYRNRKGHPSICGKSRASPRHYGKWQTDRCSESADVGQEETGLRVCGVGWVISRKRRRCYVAEQSALDTPKSTRRPSRLDSSRVGVVVIPVYYMGRSN
ncbi:hypothetical protein CDAR_534861 [Caerostris darwini]|uniref:Uncharacterized protein n=1 Tax=Caerostris darwini TaxID=1538125 RepID=A0AAV4QIW6_9ARAC|nr:hypothetical protein CDAR_534861 [Caerostris darwini]